VGMGYVQVLGYLMPVYYGPDLPKSVFSVGVFARDFGFERVKEYCKCEVCALVKIK